MCNNSGSKVFFSFLTGAAIGAGLALLFAPQTGEETRRQIKDFSEKMGNEVKNGVETASEKAKAFVDGAKDTFKKRNRI
jgi:gas vesicle protein